MLISIYTTTRLKVLVYITKNIKEYKSCPSWDKNSNKDKDKENSKNNKINNNKDKDKGNVENDKIDNNKDSDKDSAKNNKIDDTKDSKKDNVKNNKIDNKIVKAFLRHLNSIKLVKTLCYKNVNFFYLI